MKKILLLFTAIMFGVQSVTAQEYLNHIEGDTTLQELGEESIEDLSKSAANPLADLMSFPFQNNLNMNYGEYNRNMNILNIQPVIPFAGGKLITRTIIPIVRIPDFSSESGKLSSGLADVVFSAFYVPESKGVMV